MRERPTTLYVRPADWRASPRRGAPSPRARCLRGLLTPCGETPCPETPCPETQRSVQCRRRSVGSPSCASLRSVACSAGDQWRSRMRAAIDRAHRLLSCEGIVHDTRPVRHMQTSRSPARVHAHDLASGLLAMACLLLLAAGCGERGPCGVAQGAASRSVARGLSREAETVAAMQVLGLRWSADPHRSEVFFLGYPDLGLTDIAAAESTWTEDAAGLHHTYGEDFDGRGETCNGDLHHLLEGRHAELTARMLAADLDAVIDLTRPADLYTHVG